MEYLFATGGSGKRRLADGLCTRGIASASYAGAAGRHPLLLTLTEVVL